VAVILGKSYLFFLTVLSTLETSCMEKGLRNCNSTSLFGVSDVVTATLENLGLAIEVDIGIYLLVSISVISPQIVPISASGLLGEKPLVSRIM